MADRHFRRPLAGHLDANFAALSSNYYKWTVTMSHADAPPQPNTCLQVSIPALVLGIDIPGVGTAVPGGTHAPDRISARLLRTNTYKSVFVDERRGTQHPLFAATPREGKRMRMVVVATNRRSSSVQTTYSSTDNNNSRRTPN